MAVPPSQSGNSNKKGGAVSTLRSTLQSKIDYANMPPVYKIPLWELNCQFGMVKRKHADPVLLKDAIKRERRLQQADVTLLFAIRTPGWAGCREHGLQLTELAAQDPKLALTATVKETGVDDEGLLEFYERYFHSFPIYQDDKWQLYKAMGGRKVGMMSVLKMLLGAARKRHQEKNITHSANNYKSAGWMCGGVLVFDRKGSLIYVMEENVGTPLDMDMLRLAVQKARDSNEMNKMDSSEMNHAEDAPTVQGSVGSDNGL